MLPEADEIASFLILAPGIPTMMKQACLDSHHYLNELLLDGGGKRYLSGFLGESLQQSYWASHYAKQYSMRQSLKEKYDPNGVFCSLLFSDSKHRE